jgi:pilus assembly protein CpaC
VRVAEVTRDVEKRFGFNWNALFNNGTFAVGVLTGRAPVTAFGNFIRDPSTNQLDSLGLGYQSGSANISTLIDALQTEGLMSILSEPNLTATSGEPASFLAGGEFPVPISQGLQQVTVEWKRFGVSVEFTPTVLDASRISVKVRPEVSELSNSGSVTLNNITIPALTVRRAQTTVELASGQSFAIAGLFQNNVQNQVQQMPWLSDLPVLGALFRSTSFQRHESELVIIVTPYIVQPAPKPGDLHLPTENIVFASDLEQLLLGRLTGAQKPSQPSAPAAADQPHLSGAAGFVME